MNEDSIEIRNSQVLGFKLGAHRNSKFCILQSEFKKKAPINRQRPKTQKP